MTDNTDEENIGNTEKPQEENTPEEVIPSANKLIPDSDSEKDNMEVHHHAHHGEKRNWKSYFWEFLMLFLAVFCGFLAEYQLEHKIERDRAKELAKSFYQELKNDSVTAGIKVQNRLKQEAALKYMICYFKDSNLINVSKEFAINFEYGISFLSPSQFEPRTIMLEQLRNAGTLRYFKNEEIQNLSGDLIVAIKNIYHRQDIEVENRIKYINPIVIKHYDYDFDAAMKREGKNIFEGVVDYEQSNEHIPFHLNNSNETDRIDIVSVLSFFKENVVSSTRQVHLRKYIEINAKLLQVLRDEYGLK